MKVYIAGPYTLGHVVINVRNAILAGEEVIKLGHIPFIPHLNHLWHLVCPHDPDFWYEYDLLWIIHCNALIRLSGKSKGADREEKQARRYGIGVYTMEEFREYCLKKSRG